MTYSKVAKPSKKENIFGIIYGFSMFLICMPYFMWNTGKLNLIIFVAIGMVSIYNLKKFTLSNFVILLLFLFLFVYASIGNNITGLFFKLLLVSFLLIQENKILCGLKWFKKIFVISITLSLITYVALVVFSLPISYNLIKPLNYLKSDYFQYPFLVSDDILSLKNLYIRFFGMFDEPGLVGSYATILLFIDNYNFKSKQNIILFIAGFLSFSLFFIVSSIVFFFIQRSFKKRIFIIPMFLTFFFLTKDALVFNNLIWDRLTIENGQWKGDNRSSASLDANYTNFLSSDDVLWGKGINYLTQSGEIGSSSYKELVINYGIIFMIILCLSFFYFAYSYIKYLKYFIYFMFLFLGMLYQRPYIFDPAYFFIFVASIVQLRQISLNKISEQNEPANPERRNLLIRSKVSQ